MNRKGFTLIELVMVIVLIGILSVFAAPRLANIFGTNAAAFTAKLRTDIRYAQNLAMAKNQRYRVYINTAPSPTPNGYAVAYDTSGGAWASTALPPDPANPGGLLSITLNAGNFANITIGPAGYLEFNSLGAVVAAGGGIIISPAGIITITVYGGAAAAGTVTVTAQTGAVY